ncbi:peptidase [Alkalibaculum sp. M08DMB]|uniref:Peptidase n=1 Tax=Alkalibaculum sporogenes TaxID=2655001 RepID=A0A6A7KCF1_9FIRM|nr:peptidoglycan-binding protein [Alkalibaculum sporogenes]MPW27198.1 peptidase [Alkalibaculum sporogenes]
MNKTVKICTFLVLTLMIFTSSVSAQSILSFGMRGNSVNELQRDLSSIGYSVGPIDSIFGNQTRQAVTRFQRDNSLSVDGVAGPQTFATLKRKISTNNQTPSYTGLIRHGMRGEPVRELQYNLKTLGYSVGVVDGIFGNITRQSVIAFQRDNGLTVDGVVGPQTINVLQTKLNGVSNSTIINRGSNNSSSIQSTINNVISTSKSLIGIPYLNAGTTPTGFDCSGFTQYVMKQNGITIPRTAAQQYTIGTPVNRGDLKLGDFVFFTTYTSGASHLGIYVGNNSFIHSSSSVGVTITNLDNSYWNPRYIGARRIIK